MAFVLIVLMLAIDDQPNEGNVQGSCNAIRNLYNQFGGSSPNCHRGCPKNIQEMQGNWLRNARGNSPCITGIAHHNEDLSQLSGKYTYKYMCVFRFSLFIKDGTRNVEYERWKMNERLK